MQTDLQKILSITGYPGLFRYLSQARQGIIVESLKEGKRMCLPASAKVSSLSDITIYTENDEDMLLKDVFTKIKETTNGEQAISHKVPQEELMSYFESIVPQFDKEKVFPSHVKKMVEWYNILQQHSLLDFVEESEESTESAE